MKKPATLHIDKQKKDGSSHNMGSGRRGADESIKMRELNDGKAGNLRRSQPPVELAGDSLELEYVVTPQKRVIWLTKQIKKAIKLEA
jgi:hypothetical protein